MRTKIFIFIIAIWLFLSFSICLADENMIEFTKSETKTWELSISQEGDLSINGKAVKEMSYPEIKALLKEIAEIWKQCNDWKIGNDRYIEWLERELVKRGRVKE